MHLKRRQGRWKPLMTKKATVKTEQKPAVSISKFKCDFKISGQIGNVSQKDRLNFSSLAHQIENGLKNDYTEDEIKEAVIKAIKPARSLRSYLEGQIEENYVFSLSGENSNRTIPSVELNCLAARGKPQEFLICLLDLKQKVQSSPLRGSFKNQTQLFY